MAAMERRQVIAAPASNADIAEELNELVLRGLLPTVLMGVIGLVSSTFTLAHHYHDSFLSGLAWFMTVLGVTRSYVVLRLRNEEKFRRVYFASRLRQSLYQGLLLTYFTTLAASTFWNFYKQRAPAELLCCLGIFVLCLGISGRIGADPRAAKLQGVAMLLVLEVCLFDLHSDLAIVEVLCLAMFAVAHCLAVQEKFDIVVEQIRSQRELHMLAEHDSLTGLINRRGFEVAFDRLCRGDANFAVLFIDLDHFKPVNDHYGHAAGDKLLIAVAARLASLVRSKDVVARLGGDEFAILQLPLTHRSNAEALALRITEALALPFIIHPEAILIGASVGITLPEAGEARAEQLLSRADAALYLAKQQGRGRFVYGEQQRDLLRERSS